MLLNSLSQLPQNAKVCLYGAGSGGRYLARVLKKERCDVQICAFLDDNKDGSIEGVTILKPEVTIKEFGNALFILSSGYIHELSESLQRAGISDYLVANPIFFDGELITKDEWLAKIPSGYVPKSTTLPHQKAECAKKILVEEDRELYEYLIQGRNSYSDTFAEGLYQNFRHIFTPYLDFINKAVIKNVIEGGVLDGYNSMQFLSFGDGVKIYGFEPYINVYEKSQYRGFLDASGAEIFDVALWSDDGEVNFCMESSAPASKVSQSGDKIVKSIRLDSFVSDKKLKRFDFLKLDVEGAEMEILKGGMEAIMRYRPQIAVAIYHSDRDFVDIPLFLGDMLSDYIFRLGHYSPTLDETLLYAIPKELYEV